MAKATTARTVQTAATVERRPALAGQEVSASGVKVAVLPPAGRVSLRAPQEALGSLSRALGVTLPQKPNTSATKGGRTVLWLGPDEWFVLDEQGGDALSDCARAKGLHSAVDVSHRNVAFAVSGPSAEAAIAAGCPQDLSLQAFAVGACSRTVLGKSEILLYRLSEQEFRVECWRSFSDYVYSLLEHGARDAV
ncbi:sarcosine oxidase subunit gamma [Aquamicrobium ahrensii]|uniref:Sarcosine oxidase subunit gamma n=1 Tax=Aquamicrobium ahrensii TaxID=469551 RepID=A0ABV2KLA0_9HYPH